MDITPNKHKRKSIIDRRSSNILLYCNSNSNISNSIENAQSRNINSMR